MKIESPLFALNALQRTQAALNRSMQRLSSGQRINSASDDPAGLSIASGLEAQIRGVTAGIHNINESVGFLSTAEGAIATQTAITQRMRELAVNAATGTLSKTDRLYLNTEFQQLLAEFNRIAEQTNFNGTNLLDGTFTTSNIQVGSTAQQVVPISLGSTLSNIIFPTGSGTSSTTTTNGTGSFGAATNYPIQNNPFDTVFGDVNGDGKVDMIVANYSTNVQQLYLGNGNGTFQAQQTFQIAAANGMVTMQLSDLNGDGKLDLVSVDNQNARVYVSIGNGDGTFKAATIYGTTNANAFLVMTKDVNGDGKLDLVVEDNNAINTFIGNGDGTFKADVSTNLGIDNSGGWDIGDFNGDGKPDVIIGSGAGAYYFYTGNGDGSFATTSNAGTTGQVNDVVVGDFNGDGKLDFATHEHAPNGVEVYLGNGNGTFQAPKAVAVTGTSNANYQNFVTTDLNGDGKLDLITLESGTMSTYLGNGDGTFQAGKTFSTANAASLALHDLNGDGVPDAIVATTTNVKVMMATTSTNTIVTGTPAIPFDISTQTDASNILSVLDSGLANLNSERSSIGAFQSRISTALDLNQLTLQNISSARSQVMDTDMAAETSELVKNQILQQAGVAVLGQANLQNQMILKLLNF